ncbi:hypothetical protein Pan258_01830 [Symmachiella dynata]|uniref:HK97 gp10 family phage protein n=1 Tax=Symmachiella dynata TaxID=2527995 RepID=UPI001187E9FD|nr:HK97 gp10 family phage protein [Symmachiella dynata]QDT46166.1 hypothetical protein Pan258_01830 [Symmachiella dynata]
MAKVTSNIVQNGDEWLKEIEQDVEDATYRAMTKTGLVGEARLKGIIEKEAYDTGRLLRSVNSIIQRLPNEIRLVIGTNLEYAFYLEHGRKPGKWPNLDALTKWVGRKLRQQGVGTRVNVSFDQLKSLARTNGKKATKAQEAYRAHLSALYLIGRKIATKGIRGKFIFQRIEAGLLTYFRRELETELNRIV